MLDKDMKPVVIAAQEITATAGTREAPVKLTVEKSAKDRYGDDSDWYGRN